MNVRVNLLPPELAQQRRYRRRAGVIAFVVVLFGVGLGGLYVLKRGAVDTAIRERDMAQAEVDRLTAELGELRVVQGLAGELEGRNTLLAFAMANEVSFARLLNDVALTFPASSSLLTLSATLTVEPPEPGAVDPGPAIGVMSITGYSVERFAPGVESVLLDLSRVGDLGETTLATAMVGDIGDVGVTNFSGEAIIRATARTGRYADGLPAVIE